MKYLFFLCLLIPTLLTAIEYQVAFFGLEDPKTMKALESASDLVMLRKRPPASINSLRYRTESDIPQLIKVLRAFGYYDASITWSLEEEKPDFIKVYIYIHAGPRYVLESFDIFSKPCEFHKPVVCGDVNLFNLGIQLHKPAIAQEIVNAELLLLSELSLCGYPLATIDKRDVLVDVTEKIVKVSACVDEGPLAHFGPITIIGLKDIDPSYIQRRIMWKEGEQYTPILVENTQKRLVDTDLFSSVLITHNESLDGQKQLPMKIHLTESKHRSINLGASYATIDGFGGTAGWENRNFLHNGSILSIEGDVQQRAHTALLTYRKPDFLRFDQDWVTQAQALREKITVYIAFTYRLVNRIDRRFNKHESGYIGIKGEYIDVTNSISNGKYTIIGLPAYIKYTTTNSLMNPTEGFTVIYSITPYGSIGANKSFFVKQRITGNVYIPATKSRFLVFALRLQMGSILGTSLDKIPFTKRFLGGSDEDLRGYRYKTVSPTNATDDPTGGRSAIYFTLETRLRLTKSIGLVPFTDWGTVSDKVYPDPENKWFKSVGVGLRYFTFFGPLRADIAWPLDRRKRDSAFRVYISIGQTF